MNIQRNLCMVLSEEPREVERQTEVPRFDERGQALSEYIILVILVALVCLPVMKLLPEAVRGYVRPFYYTISRPLP